MRFTYCLPLPDVRDEHSGPDHVLEARAGFCEGGLDDGDAAARLGVGVTDTYNSTLFVNRGCAREKTSINANYLLFYIDKSIRTTQQ